ncbi:amidohydrolase family protein [Myxococcaceae bacterium GXIMD 01537]
MKRALRGRIVTMSARSRVLKDGVLYLDGDRIVAVKGAKAPAPEGFGPPLDVGGTLYPGLIELHNHLAYNVLRLWDVPQKYSNRDRWAGTADYRRDVTGPMRILGTLPDLMPAVVRFVECKNLIAGVTTSQGLALFSNTGSRRFYRGLVRNVEETDDAALPEADTRIADVAASSIESFRRILKGASCLLLHLSEGVDDSAHNHFLSLHQGDEWVISEALAGIHSIALGREDFDVMAAHGASMVWSPVSNLLLYGDTAKVHEARAAGVRIGLGADWSYSGSKNLLGELKVARAASEAMGLGLSDRDLVAMATRDAAAILKWDGALGSLEPGKRADLLVLEGTSADPYAALINAREDAVRLVMIGGEARYGDATLMAGLAEDTEPLTVGGAPRALALRDATADPAVAVLTLAEARARLTDALARLPELALSLEQRGPELMHAVNPLEDGPPVWFLALDELRDTGTDVRPHLPMPSGEPSGASLEVARAAQPLSTLVRPMTLDALSIADDSDYAQRLLAQRNLPEPVREALRPM